MFKSFKNKIEEEQGAELQPQLLYPAMNNPAQKKQSNWLNGGRHSFANNQKSKSHDESSTSGSNHQVMNETFLHHIRKINFKDFF